MWIQIVFQYEVNQEVPGFKYIVFQYESKPPLTHHF